MHGNQRKKAMAKKMKLGLHTYTIEEATHAAV
jgi:hypothetical protein